MRFKRWHRPELYQDTPRKRAAFLRKQRNEREALPLFADVIAERQPSVDQEMVRRVRWWDESERRTRQHRADAWPRGRATLFALEPAQRQVIRDLWRTCPYPADPSYFADLLFQIGRGSLDPQRPPWRPRSARAKDDAEPGQLRRRVPPDRPAHDRRRAKDDRRRRADLLRKPRLRHPVPDLARATERAERELLHLVEPSPARQPCRQRRPLRRDRRVGRMLGHGSRPHRAARAGRRYPPRHRAPRSAAPMILARGGCRVQSESGAVSRMRPRGPQRVPAGEPRAKHGRISRWANMSGPA